MKWTTFSHLSSCEGLKSALFQKHGGVSPLPYATLNFSTHVGDSLENVTKNRELARQALGLKRLYGCSLEHGNVVKEVGESWDDQIVCDAMMTDRPDTALIMTHADCQIAFFFDPCHRAIAIVHCGWRGSVCNIYQSTIDKMKLRYGTLASDLLVGISPSIGPESAEFRYFEKELPEVFWKYQVKPTYFDFWAISRDQLLAAGVLRENIEIAGVCTYLQRGDYFSHRRATHEGTVCGRHGAIISLS